MPDLDSYSADDERDLTAAEFVVGLLEPEAHRAAAARMEADPDFAAAARRWEARLMPLIADLPEHAPREEVWARIAAALPANRAAPAVWDRVGFWRAATAMATAAAVVLAVLLITRPAPVAQPVPEATESLLTRARIQTTAGQTVFVVVVDPATNRMIVTPLGDGGAPGHSHELWLVPSTGAPVSLGVLPGEDGVMRLPRALAVDARLAVSVEPLGGSPTGLPTGPVIAEGQLAPT